MYGRLSPSQQRALRHGAALAGVITAAWIYLIVGDRTWANPAADGLVYWRVDLSRLYDGSTVGGVNAYLYSPAFAQVFWVIGHVPREVFIVGWTAFLAGVAYWLARPWPAALLVLALPVSQDVLIGNIHVLLAAAIVLSFRWAGSWAFPLLTKATPGVGLLWLLARREWRPLAIALAVTAIIAGASFALAPQLWFDWFALLRHDGGSGGQYLVPRLAIAAVVVIWGARTNRRWAVPLAAMLALPVVWMDSFAMLLGCVALGPRPARVDQARELARSAASIA
jgi:Glycosyltransferase family 87